MEKNTSGCRYLLQKTRLPRNFFFFVRALKLGEAVANYYFERSCAHTNGSCFFCSAWDAVGKCSSFLSCKSVGVVCPVTVDRKNCWFNFW